MSFIYLFICLQETVHINQHLHFNISVNVPGLIVRTQFKIVKWIKHFIYGRITIKIRGKIWKISYTTLCLNNIKHKTQSDKYKTLNEHTSE